MPDYTDFADFDKDQPHPEDEWFYRENPPEEPGLFSPDEEF